MASIFSWFTKGRKKQTVSGEVLVYANDTAANAQFQYPHNGIRTTKYTLLTFLPKNLFEQFRCASDYR